MEKNNIISLYKANMEPLHAHSAVELIYVMGGELKITIRNQTMVAVPGNLVLFNSGEVHSIRGSDSSFYCKIDIDYKELKSAVGKRKLLFRCNSCLYPKEDYSRVCSFIENLLRCYNLGYREFQLKSLYYMLWDLISERFAEKKIEEKNGEDQLLEDIFVYISKHSAEHISQAKIAGEFYLSQSAFSKFFKEKTGERFVDYVRGLRMEQAKEMLENTNSSITKVALECGFTTVSMFNKIFKEETGMTPSAFRTKQSQNDAEANSKEMMGLLENFLRESEKTDDAEREVIQCRISQDEYIEWNGAVIDGITAGFLSDLKEGRVQNHIREYVKVLRPEYIKIYNPFDEVFEDKESFATGQLNFEYVDQVIDFLLDLAVKIYFEFPGRKKKWIIYIGKEIKRKQQKLSEISMDEWLIMLDAFLKHVIHRYSVAVVSEWMFELWMDAEDVTQVKAYQEFYEKSYKVIKRNLYDAQIGGCNVNCEAGKDALKSNFLFWKNRKCFPDFLTIMSYPYVVESSEDGEIQLNSICSDAHFVLEDIQEYEVLLKNCDCPQRPILMEWNTSLSERNFYNDSCAKACHMVRQMIDASVKGIKLYYNNLSDLTFQYYDAKGPIIGASGLITKDGIRKPAFYVNEFWKKLGNRLLAYGDNYIVTTQMEGSIHLLVHNAKPFNTDYQTKQESQIHIEELRTFFQNDHTLYVKFLIDSVKNKSYHVQKLSIKENEGSLLGEWANLGKSINLSREEITYIKNMTIPRMEVESQPVKDNQIEICLEIGANEVILVNIY